MNSEDKVISEFVENALYRLDQSTRMIVVAFTQLEEQDVWKRSNKASNSMGNLILHLCGNITQYVISSLGETEDIRERDIEFDAQSGLSKVELLKKLYNTVNKAKDVIENTTSKEWLKKRVVQGFNFSGIGVVFHAVEHYSYHTGQIAFWVKHLKNRDLGFYDGTDLSIKNED
jgi:uncharacterized damage-inducible protein DinB